MFSDGTARGQRCSKPGSASAPRKHGKEVVDLALGAEDGALEVGAVAFDAAETDQALPGAKCVTILSVGGVCLEASLCS